MSDVLLRFAHISDTHFAPEGHSHTFEEYPPEVMEVLKEAVELMGQREMAPVLPASRALIDAVNNTREPLDFVLHTGDVNTDPLGPDHYEVGKEIMAALKYPVYYLPCNHDNVRKKKKVLVGSAAPQVPYDYSFEVNGVQVICLDSATHGVNHGGKLSEDQLAWLQQQLVSSAERPVIVAVHHPLLKLGHKLLDFFGTSNGDDVHDILKQALPRLRGVFFGHIHMDFESYVDGVLYSAVPSPSVEVGQATGYKVVTVTERGTHIRHVSVPLG